uniref:Gorasp2-prov protein, putative n=1 Tax=Neospora caninum (strain Liverpool) TaxID=572307 RepID=A0A0F7UEI2_NEOCL|nr:TPA: gorasp2-prov protein, putative [Neospora caninum Liverpool]
MGAGQSLDQRGTLAVGEKARGGAYRVVKIQRGSPAEAAGLEIFFDFITQIDDVPLTSPTEETLQAFFAKVNQSNDPEPVQLVVFNARMRGFRTVTLRPAVLLPPTSRAHRSAASSVFSLGLSVSFSDVGNVMSEGVRVLSVAPNSPAAHAGLVEREDWILADSQGVFRDVEDLVDSVSAALNRHLQIFVFNAATESIREVLIVPNSDWGGEGSLGCELGSGYLHRLPFSRRALTADAVPTEKSPNASQFPLSAADGEPTEAARARAVPSGATGESEAPGAPRASRPTSETAPDGGGDSVSPGEANGSEACGRHLAGRPEGGREDAHALRASNGQGNVAEDRNEKEEMYILDSDGAPVLLTPSANFQDAYPPYAHGFDEDAWGLIPSFPEDSEDDSTDEFDNRPNFSFQQRGYCLYPVTNSPLKESFPLCNDREARLGDLGRDSQGTSRVEEASPYFAYDFPYAAAIARHPSAVFTGPPRPGEVVSASSLH